MTTEREALREAAQGVLLEWDEWEAQHGSREYVAKRIAALRAALSPGPEPVTYAERLRAAHPDKWWTAGPEPVARTLPSFAGKPSSAEAYTTLVSMFGREGVPSVLADIRTALSPGPEPVAGLDVERLIVRLLASDEWEYEAAYTRTLLDIIAREYAALGEKP